MSKWIAIICGIISIPFVWRTLAVMIGVAIAFWCGATFCSCSSEEINDRLNGLPSDDKINAQYAHPSADAPESLKPFYDPQLTQALNKVEYVCTPLEQWMWDPAHYDPSLWIEGRCLKYARKLSVELSKAGLCNKLVFYKWTYLPTGHSAWHVFVEFYRDHKKWIMDDTTAKPILVPLNLTPRQEITIIDGGDRLLKIELLK